LKKKKRKKKEEEALVVGYNTAFSLLYNNWGLSTNHGGWWVEESKVVKGYTRYPHLLLCHDKNENKGKYKNSNNTPKKCTYI
jgi:hypothetical protein